MDLAGLEVLARGGEGEGGREADSPWLFADMVEVVGKRCKFERARLRPGLRTFEVQREIDALMDADTEGKTRMGFFEEEN